MTLLRSSTKCPEYGPPEVKRTHSKQKEGEIDTYMDKKAPVKEVTSELARELLIGISHSIPERESLIEISHSTPPQECLNSKSVGRKYSNGFVRPLDREDSLEKLRAGLISLSNAPDNLTAVTP